MTKRPLSAQLDWNNLLGFEQIAGERDAIRREISGRLGAKVGNKVGEKVGVKLGAKAGIKA